MKQYIYSDCRNFVLDLMEHENEKFRIAAKFAFLFSKENILVDAYKDVQEREPDEMMNNLGMELSWKLSNIRIWQPSMTEWFDKFDHERYNKIKQMRLGR
jgi:hypothetical protein